MKILLGTLEWSRTPRHKKLAYAGWSVVRDTVKPYLFVEGCVTGTFRQSGVGRVACPAGECHLSMTRNECRVVVMDHSIGVVRVQWGIGIPLFPKRAAHLSAQDESGKQIAELRRGRWFVGRGKLLLRMNDEEVGYHQNELCCRSRSGTRLHETSWAEDSTDQNDGWIPRSRTTLRPRFSEVFDEASGFVSFYDDPRRMFRREPLEGNPSWLEIQDETANSDPKALLLVLAMCVFLDLWRW